jgi:ribosomal protein S12 methylthiotransferase RimO
VTDRPTVSLVTLGCARNDVDSEELAARLQAQGWQVAPESGEGAEVIVVNTCGFVAEAKRESIEQILALSGSDAPVVAVGCLAERYGHELAAELPEAAAVVGFDGYDTLGQTLHRVVAGEPVDSHEPTDRRRLLPLTPTRRAGSPRPPGHGRDPVLDLPGSTATVLRQRLDRGPVAPLKIASGCDRRCAFCAIPRFRGAFLSRPPDEIVAEAQWLADRGARELFLVSENSTSYGKDLGDPRLLEVLLPRLAGVDGIERVRVSYLQPAEMRPGLIDAIAGTAGVADYFDLSFQHASGSLLRAMRRFGDAESFLALVQRIRSVAPDAGVRSNVIVGFPGEADNDVAVLADFVGEAGLDAVGVFGYSAEDGTEAAGLPGALDDDEIAARVEHIAAIAEHSSAARASARVGAVTRVLVTQATSDGATGSAEFQGPQDGTVLIDGFAVATATMVPIQIVSSDGADLIGRAVVG